MGYFVACQKNSQHWHENRYLKNSGVVILSDGMLTEFIPPDSDLRPAAIFSQRVIRINYVWGVEHWAIARATTASNCWIHVLMSLAAD